MTSTEFENTGDWPTVVGEASWLAFLQSQNPSGRVVFDQVGVSTVDSLPIHRVIVTDAPSKAPAVFVAGGVHGTEPAGRNAALTLIRDFAESTDPVWVSLRSQIRLVVMPTCNPVGIRDGVRNTPTASGSLNLGGDYFNQVLNESKAVAETLAEFKPFVIHDCHEYTDPGSGSPRMGIRHTGGNPWTRDYSRAMFDHVADELTAENIPWQLYDQFIGADYGSLRNISALMHATSILTESPINDNTSSGRENRVNMYTVAMRGVMNYITENLDDLLSAQGKSVYAAMSAARYGGVPLDLFYGRTRDTWPTAYTRLGERPAAFDTFGIDGDADQVLLTQFYGFLLTRMLDPYAPLPVTTANPWTLESTPLVNNPGWPYHSAYVTDTDDFNGEHSGRVLGVTHRGNHA